MFFCWVNRSGFCRINDRCQKNIRPLPKFFLMELKFVDKDKVEIFGAKDNSERQVSRRMDRVFSKMICFRLGWKFLEIRFWNPGYRQQSLIRHSKQWKYLLFSILLSSQFTASTSRWTIKPFNLGYYRKKPRSPCSILIFAAIVKTCVR